LHFSGGHLFVNANVRGELRVEVLDREGRGIAGFSADRCEPVRGDATTAPVKWIGANLAALAGQPIRFRFLVSDADLFAFWVSRSERGESHGYIGAGGPGFASYRDV
jgi:hypothetical protein